MPKFNANNVVFALFSRKKLSNYPNIILALVLVTFRLLCSTTVWKRSTAVPVSVKTLTDNETVSINGTRLHMNDGNGQYCKSAA